MLESNFLRRVRERHCSGSRTFTELGGLLTHEIKDGCGRRKKNIENMQKMKIGERMSRRMMPQGA
jgi:hypothetical protein